VQEDSWMRCEREWFVVSQSGSFNIDPRALDKVIKAYNMLLQKALFGESEYVAQDLKLTVLRARGASDGR